MDNRLRAALLLVTTLMILDREGLLEDDAGALGPSFLPFAGAREGDSDRDEDTEDDSAEAFADAMIPPR